MRMIPPRKVSEIMSREIVTVSEDDSIGKALAIFEEKEYNSLPVVRDGLLVGMISKLDVLKAINNANTKLHPGPLDLENEMVKDFMRKATVSIRPEDDLRTAAAYMVEFRLRTLPVVKAGKVVGMLSEGDIMDNLVSA
ncbi:MAG: CBS domain-containing protein [Methanomassiliicoccales archaeon]|nr:MAG: CBS domain-containing protein [Methanomassiliicoccales archaeon]